MTLSLMFVGLSSCESYRTTVVVDFTKILYLEADDVVFKERTVNLKLRIKSLIDQPVELELNDGDKLMRKINLGTGEKKTIITDCYTDKVKIKFVGNIPKEGKLSIEYKFIHM